jgi:phosphoribosylformimino-5-aminoimidazole carboxamide ribotide isomerase
MGANRIHVVDLDGAASGEVMNWNVIELIATAVQVPTQLGGGIRSLKTIERVLKTGIERTILGTVAVEDSALVKTACFKYGDAIAVSIDAREGVVAVRGWRQGTELKAVALAQQMVRQGVRRFIYTDISQDGTLAGPNVKAIRELIGVVNRPVIAAGGISSIADLKALKEVGIEGAIVGKALYTGHVDLKEALDLAID